MARGFHKPEAKLRAEEALESLESTKYANVPADKLSSGLKRRVLVAMTIATDAELLFLVEPILGLDAVNRRKVWSVIREHCRRAGSVLLTTNYLDEAESLSDRVAILERGEIISQGGVEELKSPLSGKVRVDVSSGFSVDELESFGRVVKVADKLRVFTDGNGSRELAEMGVKRGIRVGLSPISLEDIFLDLVGE